jgi:hypothetical protein
VCGSTLREVLTARGVGPDFSYRSTGPDAEVDFVHRSTPDAEIYFLRNKNQRWDEITAEFRVHDRIPEFWLPDSGDVVPARVYSTTAKGITLPLQLAPEGSLFVVFRKGPEQSHILSLQRNNEPVRGGGAYPEVSWTGDQHLIAFQPGRFTLALSGGKTSVANVAKVPAAINLDKPWDVRFEPGRGAPEHLQFPRLTSWTEAEDPGIRYFSGIAEYQTIIDVPAEALAPATRAILDLGKLWAVAEVAMNGKPLGVIWKAPYRVDVTSALHAGANTLSVKVANDWINRLIGDARNPSGKQYTRTNIKGIWTQMEPVPSGLLGPVELHFGAILE